MGHQFVDLLLFPHESVSQGQGVYYSEMARVQLLFPGDLDRRNTPVALDQILNANDMQ